MELMNANEIERYQNWTALIYAEAGIGKTTMVKGLKGNTILFSTDGMYHVLSGVPNVRILVMDSKKPNDELGNFYRYLLQNIKTIDNIVIDNLSTFQEFWLNATAKDTKSGMPELKDYGIVDRVLLEFIASLKGLNKNVLLLAHEKKVEITRTNGGVYTQFQPDVRNMDAIMGIIPIVGRMLIVPHPETHEDERIIVLQPTQSTRAKDQLIGNKKTIKQMDLIPELQNNL